MPNSPSTLMHFSEADFPIKCDFPSQFQTGYFDHTVSQIGYILNAGVDSKTDDEFAVEIRVLKDQSKTFAPNIDRYLDAIVEGRCPENRFISNGLPHAMEFPLQTPFVLRDGTKAYHAAANFLPPCPSSHFLFLRAFLPKGKLEITLSGDGEVAEAIDLWLILLNSLQLKEFDW